MMLFAIIFVVVIVAVGVLKYPSKYRKLPHTVHLLLCVSALFGRISYIIRPYVTFFVAKRTSLLGINVKVFIPFILVPNPWANPPNSFSNYLNHMSLSGPFIRCLYSCTCPFIGFRIDFSWSCICAAAYAYCGFVSNFEYFGLRMYLLFLGNPMGSSLENFLGSPLEV